MFDDEPRLDTYGEYEPVNFAAKVSFYLGFIAFVGMFFSLPACIELAVLMVFPRDDVSSAPGTIPIYWLLASIVLAAGSWLISLRQWGWGVILVVVASYIFGGTIPDR